MRDNCNEGTDFRLRYPVKQSDLKSVIEQIVQEICYSQALEEDSGDPPESLFTPEEAKGGPPTVIEEEKEEPSTEERMAGPERSVLVVDDSQYNRLITTKMIEHISVGRSAW